MDDKLVFEALRRGLITPEMAKEKLGAPNLETKTREAISQERTDKMPAVVRAGIGVGAGLTKAGVGAIQAGADLVGAENVSDAAGNVVNRIDADIARLRGAGNLGAFVGEVGPYIALPGGGAKLAGRVLAGSGAGAAAGVLKPVGADEDYNRATGAAVGGALGAAVPVGLEGVRKGVQNTYGALIKPNAKIKDFMNADLPVSAGQAAGGGLAAGERLLSQFPISGAPLRKLGERQKEALESGIKNVASGLSQEGAERGANLSASSTGGTLRRGLQSTVQNVGQKTEQLYNKVYDQVKPDTVVDTTPALAVIAKAKESFPNNPEAAAKAGLGKVTEWEKVLTDPLRFADLKSLKQSIWATAEKAENAEVKPLLKELYRGVDDSLKLTASKAVPGSDLELKRADRYYQVTRDFVDRVGKMVDTPADEKLLNDFLRLSNDPSKGGADIRLLRQIDRKMPIKVIREIGAYKLASMGLEKAGQEGTDRTLSARTFVTEWKNMSSEAKNILFGRQLPMNQIQALNRLVDYADTISKSPLNKSGTAAGVGEIALGTTAANSALSGYDADKLPKTLAWTLAPVLLAKGATSQSAAKAINKLPSEFWKQPPEKIGLALSSMLGQSGLGQ